MKLNRIGRKINNRAQSIARSMTQDTGGLKRDYAQGSRKGNPMFATRAEKNHGIYIKLGLAACLFIVTVILMLSNSFFRIKQIEVIGTSRVDNGEVVKAIEGILDGQRLGFFSNRNYFLTNVEEIREILRSRFPIAEIIVIKTFPNKVSVELKEKITQIIFDNGRRYAFLNESGQVLEVIRSVGDDEWYYNEGALVENTIQSLDSTSTFSTSSSSTNSSTFVLAGQKYHVPSTAEIRKQAGDFPILYDARPKTPYGTSSTTSTSFSLEKGENAIEEDFARKTIAWYSELVGIIGQDKIDYFVIQNDIGFGELKLRDGSHIKLNILSDRPSAVEAIDLLLHDKLKGSKFEYIDVRFPGRVYWK